MIIGNIPDLERHCGVIICWRQIYDFIERGEWPEFGTWLSLSDSLRVIRLNNWNQDHKWLEAHRAHFDLHYTIKGSDRLFVSLAIDETETVKPYDPEKDYVLYKSRVDLEVSLQKGRWALILPHEPHRNELETEQTEKLVFKIRIT
jgi:YhcH/YjgK/YiaL family protein